MNQINAEVAKYPLTGVKGQQSRYACRQKYPPPEIRLIDGGLRVDPDDVLQHYVTHHFFRPKTQADNALRPETGYFSV